MHFIWLAGSKLGLGNRVLLTALPGFVLLPKWSVPKSLLPPAAALHRHKVLCRIACDSICQMKICCCPCSNENSARAWVSIVQDMKHEFVLPLCHCPCPINSIVSCTWGRALLGGSSWSSAILAGIQNQQTLWHWWWKSWTAAAFPFNHNTSSLLICVQTGTKKARRISSR